MGQPQPDRNTRLILSAKAQHGVVTRQQALHAGFSPAAIARSIQSGRWKMLHRGIYLVDPGAARATAVLLGNVLRAPGRTWASHRSAAHLWGLWTPAPEPAEITTMANLRGNARIVRVATLPRSDQRSHRGIAVTSPERTLVDLAAVGDHDVVEAAVLEATRAALTTIRRLRTYCRATATPGRSGPAQLLRTLAGWDGQEPESLLEVRLYRLMHSHGLPPFERQWPIRDGGRVIARVDAAYPREKIAIEADGYRWHSGAAQWRSDLERRNALTRSGWLVLHFTWDDVHRRPGIVASTIRAALARSGSSVTARRESAL